MSATTIELMMNDLIQSRLDQINQEHSINGEINVEKLKELCKFNSGDISRIISSSTRTTNKIKRPQSGYFLYLNDNRDKITEVINSQRKAEWESEHGSIPSDGSQPWTLKGKDKVTLVTKWAGTNWKENMSEEEKQPYLEKAATLKQEYDLAKQNNTDEVISEPTVKRGRGRPKGSKNKKTKEKEEMSSNTSSPSPSSSPPPSSNSNDNTDEDDDVVKVKKFNYNGKDYLLDSKRGDLYDISTQDIIGKYDGTNVTFN